MNVFILFYLKTLDISNVEKMYALQRRCRILSPKRTKNEQSRYMSIVILFFVLLRSRLLAKAVLINPERYQFNYN